MSFIVGLRRDYPFFLSDQLTRWSVNSALQIIAVQDPKKRGKISHYKRSE